MTSLELREVMPGLENITYLNYGATGPSPRPVIEAIQKCLARHEYDAPREQGMYPFAFDVFEDVRLSVAEFVGVEADEIALTQSTSDGINRFACAFDWQSNDVIVRTDLEHPAGILPWEHLQRHKGVEIRVVPSDAGRIDLDAYKAAVRDADLVCLSALTWNYGTRLPVSELVDIAHDAGAVVLVDAVQSVGQEEVAYTEWGADAVAAAGHKWVLGPWGAGFLYVRRGLAEQLDPATIGYRSVADPSSSEYQLKPGATRFEVGTTNPAPFAGLQCAIELVQEIGCDRIRERIIRLSQRLIDGLPAGRVISPACAESGLVTIDVEDPEEAVERLHADGFVLRSLPEPDAIRASVHAVNTANEVDALIEYLQPQFG